jgi:hypothetical protein
MLDRHPRIDDHLEAEALIREARRLRRRRWLIGISIGVTATLVGGGLYLASGRGSGGGVPAPPGASSRPVAKPSSPHQQVGSVTSIGLTGTFYDTVLTVGGQLQLESSSGPPCQTAEVTPLTLRLSSISESTSEPCVYGAFSPSPSVPKGAMGTEITNFAGPRPVVGPNGTNTEIRLVGPNRKLGPVVLWYHWASYQQPAIAYGGGHLWIYDAATAHGPELLQLSERTGQVEDTIAMPGYYYAIVEADGSGVWISQGPQAGPTTGLARVIAGSSHADVIRSFAGNVGWMTENAGALWVGVYPPSEPCPGCSVEQVWLRTQSGRWKLVVPQAEHSVPLAADGSYFFVAPVGTSSGLATEEVVRVNPATGASAIVTAKLLPATRIGALAREGQAYFDGAIYVLVNARLYRVEVA